MEKNYIVTRCTRPAMGKSNVSYNPTPIEGVNIEELRQMRINRNIKMIKAIAFSLNNAPFSFSAEWDDDHITVSHRGLVIATICLEYQGYDAEFLVVETYEGEIEKFPFILFRGDNEELLDKLTTLLYSLCW